MRTKLTTTAAALVLTAVSVLGTGCTDGSAPGAAARVGGETVSQRSVGTLAKDYCPAFLQQLNSEVAVPMSLLKTQVLLAEVDRVAAEQAAEEYGVSTGSTYRNAVSAIRQRSDKLSERAAEAKLQVEAARAYHEDIFTAAAEKQLRAEGSSSPDLSEVNDRASRLRTRWFRDHKVTVDPRYNVEFRNGRAEVTDGALSTSGASESEGLALIDDLQQAESQPEAQELQRKIISYARSLPASQRCG